MTDIENLVFNTQNLKRFTPDITVLINGNGHLASFANISAAALANDLRLNAKSIKKLVCTGKEIKVIFDDTESSFDLVLHTPPTNRRDEFVERLGLARTASGYIQVSMTQQTSRRGVFAIEDGSAPVKQVVVAMGAGFNAGVTANREITKDDS